MNKSPAFQWYAADYLADENVQLMTLEEEGAYIRLLSYCWREGSIPADTGSLSRLCKNADNQIIGVVIKCFIPSHNDPSRLVHQRLENERGKQADWRKKSSDGGKKGAASRWKSGNSVGNKSGHKVVTPPPIPNDDSSSSSSSSDIETKSNEDRDVERPAGMPDLEGVLAFAKESAISPECAEKWFWNNEAVNWTDKFNRVLANWRAALRGYWKTWAENARREAVKNPQPKRQQLKLV